MSRSGDIPRICPVRMSRSGDIPRWYRDVKCMDYRDMYKDGRDMKYKDGYFGDGYFGWNGDAMHTSLRRRMSDERAGEEDGSCLSSFDFTNTSAIDHFYRAGGWVVLPDVVIARIDVRCLYDVDVVSGTFKLNFAFCTLSYDSSRADEPPLLYAVSPNAAKDEYIFKDCELETWRKPKSFATSSPIEPRTHPGNYVYEQWGFLNEVEFFETYELQQFPFDVQDCTVYVNLFLPSVEKDGLGRKVLPVPGLLNNSAVLTDWEFLAPEVDVINDGKTFVLRLRLQRKHTWFVVNQMAVVGMLTTLAFYVRGIDPDDLANRSSVTFTLVLTVTAAKLVVADQLPKLPYLTVIDWYVVACFAVLIAVLLENFVVGYLLLDEEGGVILPDISQDSLDGICLLGLALLWLAFNAMIVWRIRRRLADIRNTFGEPERQLPFDMPASAAVRHNSESQVRTKVLYSRRPSPELDKKER